MVADHSPKTMKDVIILAKGESRRFCPFDAEEVWGVNDIANFPEFKGKQFDKLFAFDPIDEDFIRGMREVAPIVSWQPYADIEYPIDELTKKFNSRYFTNTVSYMIAYAIFCQIPLIRLYGADAVLGGVYALEKSGIEYWLGRAHERGIEVQVSEGSHLLRTLNGKMYGEAGGDRYPFYLSERLEILNLLPRKGRYNEVFKANLARWMFSVKEDEGKKYGVKITQNADGSISFTCPAEFVTDLWLPKGVWDYIVDILKETEAKGELPVTAISVYEKLVLVPNPDGKS